MGVLIDVVCVDCRKWTVNYTWARQSTASSTSPASCSSSLSSLQLGGSTSLSSTYRNGQLLVPPVSLLMYDGIILLQNVLNTLYIWLTPSWCRHCLQMFSVCVYIYIVHIYKLSSIPQGWPTAGHHIAMDWLPSQPCSDVLYAQVFLHHPNVLLAPLLPWALLPKGKASLYTNKCCVTLCWL